MSKLRSLGHRQRGATMVEFAIVAGLFFLIVMGIFDFGRAILYYNMLSNAAREGARAGIARPPLPLRLPPNRLTENEICAVAGAATNLPDVGYPVSGCGTFGSLDVAVPQLGSWQTGDADTDPLRVTLTYRFSPITPLIGAIVAPSGNLAISASSTMYVEYAP